MPSYASSIMVTLSASLATMHALQIVLGLLLVPSLACAKRYTLHHRISPSTSWSERGVITLEDASVGGSASYEDLTGKSRPWDALAGSQADSTQLYQLALTPESTKSIGPDTPMTFARLVSTIWPPFGVVSRVWWRALTIQL